MRGVKRYLLVCFVHSVVVLCRDYYKHVLGCWLISRMRPCTFEEVGDWDTYISKFGVVIGSETYSFGTCNVHAEVP